VGEPRGVPSFHIDRVGQADRDRLVWLLDEQAALPGVVRMRRWVREELAVRPGQTAVDLGCGTGGEVVELAGLVGDGGRAIGIDPNPAVLALAAQRARGTGAEFVEGSAYALPLPDASVDALRCERVYQHLDDPARATGEIARVLRPGGRVALIDSDWATAIFHPGDPEILDILRTGLQADVPNPNSGRGLRGLLTAAGLVVDELGSEAVIWESATVLPMCQAIAGAAVEQGELTAAQRDGLLADIEAGIATGDHHFSVTMFAVLAHRPASGVPPPVGAG